jgi:hypothetical protein
MIAFQLRAERMRRCARSVAFGIFWTAALSASRAGAAFVNGVETFAGTTRDTDTWVAHDNNGGPDGISQNNGLTLNNPLSPSFPTFYYTKLMTVGVGQGVTADVNLTALGSGGAGVALVLFDRPLSATDNVWVATRTIKLECTGVFHVFYWTASAFGDGSGSQLPVDQPYGKTWTWEIDRPAPNAATYSVFDENHTLQQTVSIPDVTGLFPVESTGHYPMPDQMYIGLFATQSRATIERVAIVPEPGAVAGIAIVAVFGARACRGRQVYLTT